MTATGAPEAASLSRTDSRCPALAAMQAACALALGACSTTGPFPGDAGQAQDAGSLLAPGNDYDALSSDPGDAVVDASVPVYNDHPSAPLVRSLDVATPQRVDLWQWARTRFVLDLEERPRFTRETQL